MSVNITPIDRYIRNHEWIHNYKKCHIIMAAAAMVIAAIAGALLHPLYSQWDSFLQLGINGTIIAATSSSSILSALLVLGIYMHYRSGIKKIKKEVNPQALVQALMHPDSKQQIENRDDSSKSSNRNKNILTDILQNTFTPMHWDTLFNTLESEISKNTVISYSQPVQTIAPDKVVTYIYTCAPEEFRLHYLINKNKLQAYITENIDRLLENTSVNQK